MRLLKYILIFFLGIILFALPFIFHAISEIPPEALDRAPVSEKREYSMAIFEEGGLVQKDIFKIFHLFSYEEKDFEKWKTETKVLVEEPSFPKHYVFLKDFSKRELRKNTCAVIYCLGYKMRFEEIPSVFWRGLIGIEDNRFLEHFGVDYLSILRAILTDLKKFKLVQGGSTITQQLIKNLFYSNQKSFYRKIKEMIVAVYLEMRYEKEDILEAYFNEVFWGAIHGIRVKGIHAASLVYFGKKVSEITPFEAAILVSMLKGPEYYHPLRHLDRLKERALIVYNKLVELNLFPYDKEEIWNKGRWEKWNSFLKNSLSPTLLKSLWRASVKKSSLYDDYRSMVYYSSSLELLSYLKNKQKKLKTRDGDFSVRIMVKDLKKKEAPFTYYSKYERNEEKALFKEKFQVGSTLKPLFYSFFFQYGEDEENLISLAPLELDLPSGKWSPREAHKVNEAEASIKEALQLSYNRPVIALAQKHNFERLEKDLLGFLPTLKLPLKDYPSQLLGAIELSVSELTETYTQLVKKECQRYLETGSEKNNVLYILSDPSQTTVRRLVLPNLKAMSFFGKTGTSNQGRNNWFVFFDGRRLGVFLVSVEAKNEGDEWNLYGGTTAFKIFQNIALGQGLRVKEFRCDL